MGKLKEVIEERRISGAELARGTGITSTVIYNLIAGKQYAWPGYRKKIAEYLDVPEDELFEEVER